MERENKVWEGQGSLWQNLAIYETPTGYVGVLSNSLSFMSDMEIEFGIDMNFEDAVSAITNKDYEYGAELAMYADEG